MKAIIVGNGIQGKKRKFFLKKKEFICSVDPYCSKSRYKLIENVPVDLYDTVFICTPESEKIKIIEYCIKNKKKRSLKWIRWGKQSGSQPVTDFSLRTMRFRR